MYSVKSLDRLVEEFSQLPGIGQKSAQRLAFFVSKAPKDYGKKLTEAIRQVMEKVKYCSICGNVTESDPCPICQDTRRDRSTICVVEEPGDVFIFERAEKLSSAESLIGKDFQARAGVAQLVEHRPSKPMVTNHKSKSRRTKAALDNPSK